MGYILTSDFILQSSMDRLKELVEVGTDFQAVILQSSMDRLKVYKDIKRACVAFFYNPVWID